MVCAGSAGLSLLHSLSSSTGVTWTCLDGCGSTPSERNGTRVRSGTPSLPRHTPGQDKSQADPGSSGIGN